MARKCARTFSIVVEKGKKSILEVRHLLPVGIARSVSRGEWWVSNRCPLSKPKIDGGAKMTRRSKWI